MHRACAAGPPNPGLAGITRRNVRALLVTRSQLEQLAPVVAALAGHIGLLKAEALLEGTVVRLRRGGRYILRPIIALRLQRPKAAAPDGSTGSSGSRGGPLAVSIEVEGMPALIPGSSISDANPFADEADYEQAGRAELLQHQTELAVAGQAQGWPLAAAAAAAWRRKVALSWARTLQQLIATQGISKLAADLQDPARLAEVARSYIDPLLPAASPAAMSPPPPAQLAALAPVPHLQQAEQPHNSTQGGVLGSGSLHAASAPQRATLSPLRPQAPQPENNLAGNQSTVLGSVSRGESDASAGSRQPEGASVPSAAAGEIRASVCLDATVAAHAAHAVPAAPAALTCRTELRDPHPLLLAMPLPGGSRGTLAGLRRQVGGCLSGALSCLAGSHSHLHVLGRVLCLEAGHRARHMQRELKGALAARDVGRAEAALGLLSAASPLQAELAERAQASLGCGLSCLPVGATQAGAADRAGEVLLPAAVLASLGEAVPQRVQRAVEDCLHRLQKAASAAAAASASVRAGQAQPGGWALACRLLLLGERLRGTYESDWLPLVERLGHVHARRLWEGSLRDVPRLGGSALSLLSRACQDSSLAREALEGILPPVHSPAPPVRKPVRTGAGTGIAGGRVSSTGPAPGTGAGPSGNVEPGAGSSFHGGVPTFFWELQSRKRGRPVEGRMGRDKRCKADMKSGSS